MTLDSTAVARSLDEWREHCRSLDEREASLLTRALEDQRRAYRRLGFATDLIDLRLAEARRARVNSRPLHMLGGRVARVVEFAKIRGSDQR